MVYMAGPETIDHDDGLAIRPLRVREYELLAETGAFENEKVELLYGRIELPTVSVRVVDILPPVA